MILLVSHKPEIAQTLSNMLKAEGYPVTILAEGDECVPSILAFSPNLLLVDLYIQNPSGLEVLRQVRARGYAGKIIVLSGVSLSSAIPLAMRFGVDQVLGPPLDFGQVLSAVHVAIGSSDLSLVT